MESQVGAAGSKKRRVRKRPITHPIRDAREYESVMGEIESLLDSEGQAARDRLGLLSILAEAYEEANFPAPRNATPQELVEFMAAQRGLGRGELATLMGGRSRLSDFLAGKRALSRSQIIQLRDALGIPADLLI
jgi:HTH-type transcriptional regulator/antitoxin HigA